MIAALEHVDGTSMFLNDLPSSTSAIKTFQDRLLSVANDILSSIGFAFGEVDVDGLERGSKVSNVCTASAVGP